MKMPVTLAEAMLAPCGLDCTACYAHLRRRNTCPGCRAEGSAKPHYCQVCAIATCTKDQGLDRCALCATFPCPRVKRLAKRYRQGYGVDLLALAARRQAVGTVQYLLEERQRWACPACGGVVCMHDHLCSECGQAVGPPPA
ncbi:MAG: DUF3795 domain-containing protein [Chloroflexota bacterium]